MTGVVPQASAVDAVEVVDLAGLTPDAVQDYLKTAETSAPSSTALLARVREAVRTTRSDDS